MNSKTKKIYKWDFSYLAYHDGSEEISGVLLNNKGEGLQAGDHIEIYESAVDKISCEDYMIVDVWRHQGVPKMTVIVASIISVSHSFS